MNFHSSWIRGRVEGRVRVTVRPERTLKYLNMAIITIIMPSSEPSEVETKWESTHIVYIFSEKPASFRHIFQINKYGVHFFQNTDKKSEYLRKCGHVTQNFNSNPTPFSSYTKRSPRNGLGRDEHMHTSWVWHAHVHCTFNSKKSNCQNSFRPGMEWNSSMRSVLPRQRNLRFTYTPGIALASLWDAIYLWILIYNTFCIF